MSYSRVTHTSAIASLRRRFATSYLVWLSFVLLGYALLGKGFAYLGVRPFFIGEVTLLLGVGILAANARSATFILNRPLGWLLTTLAFWGAVCTVPNIATYGFVALRDAVLWGYAVFAVVVAALIVEKPTLLPTLVRRYQRFIVLFVGLIWLMYSIIRIAPGLVPQLPGSPVSLIHVKPGDVQVHLGGAAVFLLLGMARARMWLVLLLVAELFVCGVYNRGGFVAACLAILVTLALRPSASKYLPRLALGMGALFLLFVAVDPIIPNEGKGREVSLEQIQQNVTSIFSESQEGGGLQGTKEWRLNWWGDILSYTFNGPYFWTGKGFGVNLATSDGYQVTYDESLRSPHNAHVTMLARAGVPGFVLWLVLQLTWLVQMLRAYFRSMNANESTWSNVFLFLIAYWLAFMTNASFDVFLEGPMGGIWFWVVFGVGVGALHIYRYRPEVLSK